MHIVTWDKTLKSRINKTTRFFGLCHLEPTVCDQFFNFLLVCTRPFAYDSTMRNRTHTNMIDFVNPRSTQTDRWICFTGPYKSNLFPTVSTC